MRVIAAESNDLLVIARLLKCCSFGRHCPSNALFDGVVANVRISQPEFPGLYAGSPGLTIYPRKTDFRIVSVRHENVSVCYLCNHGIWWAVLGSNQ